MAIDLGTTSTDELIRQARQQAKQPATTDATADLLISLATRLDSAQRRLAGRDADLALQGAKISELDAL